MSTILSEHEEAKNWAEEQEEVLSRLGIFGTIARGVLWTDAAGPDGTPIVPGDPADLVDEINTSRMPLLKGHDPGVPVGQVLAAKQFTTKSGERFVAGIIGFYSDSARLTFGELGLAAMPVAASPTALPALPDDFPVFVSADPKEVDATWLAGVASECPVDVVQGELSHNAAESFQELIRIALPYVVLVWNPFVTTIATEAGKATYHGLNQWLRKLVKKLGERRNPILEIQSEQDGCRVSFLLRGTTVEHHYQAHDQLPQAAAQAAQLISHLKRRRAEARTLTYEYDSSSRTWYPSYAVLRDGRIVSDRSVLIAAEKIPPGLSLGLVRHQKK